MNLLKYLFYAVLVFVAFTIYARYGNHPKAAVKVVLPVSDAGFVTLPPSNLPNDKAIILTLPGCPKAETKRARELDFQLMQAGIPREMRSDVSFSFSNDDEKNLLDTFTGSATYPLVFVRGKGRGNPTVMEVVSEFRGVPLKQPHQEQKE